MTENYQCIIEKIEKLCVSKLDLYLNKIDEEMINVCDLYNHIKPGTNYQPNRVNKGIPFLNVKNINDGYIDISDVKYISIEDYNKVHKEWKPEYKDILISRIGTLGLVSTIEKENLPISVHYNFIVLKSNIVPYELSYFFFKTNYFKEIYLSKAKQSVQQYITIEDFETLNFKDIFTKKLFNNECINLYQTIHSLRLKIDNLKLLKKMYLKKFFN